MDDKLKTSISANKTKSWIIMVFFALFVAMLGLVFGKISGHGLTWAMIAFLLAGVASLGGYFFGDKMILGISNAHEADKVKDENIYTIIGNITLKAGLPILKVYIIEDRSPNAFATGRDPNHAVICVTRGLIDKLKMAEIEGVVAHELSHIRNYDTRLMVITSILVGTVAFMADWFVRSLWWGESSSDNNNKNISRTFLLVAGILLAVISPIIATIIQLVISRRREFLADASGVLFTRNPEGLITALEKISNDRSVLRSASNATAHLFIENPFKGKKNGAWWAGLFNTHPPIEERIKILRSL